MLSGSKRTASGEIIGSNFWQKNLGHDVGHGSCEVVTGGCSKPVCVNPAHLRLDYNDPDFSHDEAHSHWSCLPPSGTGQLDACHHGTAGGLFNFSSDICLENLCQTAHPTSVETTEDHCDGFVMSCAPCAPPCAAPCYGDQHCDAACEDPDCADICYDEDCAEPECHSPYCPDDLCLVDEVCTQSPCPRAPSWDHSLDSHRQQDGLDFNFDPTTFDLGFEEEKGTQALLQLRSHGSKEPLDMNHTCPLTAHGWDPPSAPTSLSGPSTQLYPSCSSGFPASSQYPLASGLTAPASTQSCNIASHNHHHGPYYHVDHIHHSFGGRHSFAFDVASHYDSSTTCPPTPSSFLYTSNSNVSSPGPNLPSQYSSLFQTSGLSKPPRDLSNRTRKRAKRAESLSLDLDGDVESVVGQGERIKQSVEKTCLWELEDTKEGQSPVLCNKVFTSSKDLAAHMKQCHAAGVNGQHQCRWHGCNTKTQDFKQAGKLDRHFSTHNGYKRFQCHYCNHCSSTQQGLENHENTHTGHKPYKCEYPGCNYMAATATQKQNHYRSKHLKEKRFKCKYPGCTFDCTDSSNLTKHENGVHATKHFKCPHPGCTFPVVYNWTEIRHHFKESKHCPELMDCHSKAQKQYKKSCVRKWPLPEGAERKASVRSDRTGSVKSEATGEVQELEGLALIE